MKRLVKWLPLAIAGAAIVAYTNSFECPFLFDDAKVIVQNPDIHKLWPPVPASRMLVDLTFKLNYAIGGFNVADYHAVNLAVHILAALLLYGIIRRTCLLPVLRTMYGSSGPWIGVVSATLWVVHPLQTQSVTYICQRYESVMALFLLLTLYAFVRGAGGERKRVWFDCSILACALGMGSKEVMVVAPVLVLLYDYVFVAESLADLVRRRWRVHAALFGTLGIFAALWLGSMTKSLITLTPLAARLSPWVYFMTQWEVILHYLKLAAFPKGLCLDYAWPPVDSVLEVLPEGILIGTIGMWAAVSLWRRRVTGFLWTWFFVVLGPTSSIVPVADMAFEQRMYLPLAGVIVLLVAGGERVLRGVFRGQSKGVMRMSIGLGLAGVASGMFMVVTIDRNRDYRSEETMWRDVVAKRPRNARAYLGLNAGLLKRKEYDEAEEYGRRLLALLPDFSRMSYAELPKGGETPAARRVRYHSFLYASCRNNMGTSRFNQGDVDGAIEHYREAIRIFPDYVAARDNLAFAFFRKGMIDDAILMWRKVLAIEQGNSRANARLGMMYSEKKLYSAAVEHYEKALDAEPDYIFVKFQLAWLFATCRDPELRDGDMAVDLALDVCSATASRSARAFDALGAAYAEAGEFERAVQAAERAIEILAGKGGGRGAGEEMCGPLGEEESEEIKDPLEGALRAEAVRKRQALYRQRKQYHFY